MLLHINRLQCSVNTAFISIGKPTNVCSSLDCDIRSTVVVWNQTCSISEICLYKGFPVKNPPANAGDVGSIPGWERSPGGGNGNPIHCSCLENLTDTLGVGGSSYSPGVAKVRYDLATKPQPHACTSLPACSETKFCKFSNSRENSISLGLSLGNCALYCSCNSLA